MIAGRLHWRPPRRQSCPAGRIWRPSIFRWLARAHGGRHKTSRIVACARWRGWLALHRPGRNRGFRERSGLVSSGTDDRKPHAEEGSHRSAHNQRHWQRLFGRDLARCAISPVTLTQKLNRQEWERLFTAARQTLDLWIDRLVRRSGGRLSREGYCVSRRHGGSRALWKALSQLRRKDSADSLCRQRNELLRSMPNGRETSRGPQPLPPLRSDWPRTLEELEALKRS